MVFSMGEGDGVHGGDDIRITHLIPRTYSGGVTIFQGMMTLDVAEDLFPT